MYKIFTVLVALLLPGLSLGLWGWLKDLVGVEHCDGQWIEPKMAGLRYLMNQNLYGQHLASSIIPTLIDGHRNTHRFPDKPLVLSLHGWTGVGKNYVSKMIAESLYKRGLNSSFVHQFIATVDFQDTKQAANYKTKLQDTVRDSVRDCRYSLFIFDEVDKMPPGVLDGIKPYLDHFEHIDGVDYRSTIFVFLSNNGGSTITKTLYEHQWTKRLEREDLRLKHIEPMVQKAIFNEEGGLQRSTVIDRNLVSAFVPFLPLEREHVKQCIRHNAQQKRLHLSEKVIEEVAEELEYWPDDSQLYSKSGCKRVDEKVNLYRHMHDEL